MTDDSLLDAIEDHVPYDGPHTPETVSGAARGLYALMRYLNNATGPWNRRTTLAQAATVDHIVDELAAATFGMQQLLDQLADALRRHGDDPSLYDDRRDRPAYDTADEAVERLRHAHATAGVLAAELRHAERLTGYLGNHDTGDASAEARS